MGSHQQQVVGRQRAGAGRRPRLCLATWFGHAAARTLVALGSVMVAASSALAATSDSTHDAEEDGHLESGDGIFLNLAPGMLLFDSGAKVTGPGGLLPGASVKIAHNETLITEFGYRWRHVAFSITGGVPPLATVRGAGSLASLGTLGHIRYGPVVLASSYRFDAIGPIRPYVGAGPVFLLIFKNQDGVADHLEVRNHVGAAAQVGAQYRISSRWEAYVDAKKALLRTTATASLNDTPIRADIRLNPTVLTCGLSYRF